MIALLDTLPRFSEGDQNQTNLRILSKAYGYEMSDWPGNIVELFAGEVEFEGAMQPAILIRPISEPVVSPPASTPLPKTKRQRQQLRQRHGRTTFRFDRRRT